MKENTLLKEEIVALEALMKRLGYKTSLKEISANLDNDEELCDGCGQPCHPCVPCSEVNGNHVDSEYFRLLNLILEEGRIKKNRTGIDTIGVFGAQAKYDVDLNAFPILTTKKVWFKGIVHELLWFIRGETNIKYLVDHDVHIWDEWAYKRYVDYCKQNPKHTFEHNPHGDMGGNRWHSSWSQARFIEEIKADQNFALRWGNLGEGTYGGMWRAFPYHKTEAVKWEEPSGPNGFVHTDMGTVDQLKKVVEKLKTNPDDRRMIVSAWHPYWVDHCALPPCHCMFHFNTEELTENERVSIANDRGFIPEVDLKDDTIVVKDLDKMGIPKRRLNCLLYQRSCDTFLGVPFNITSYALLTAMMAHCTNMVPGTFTHTYGDLHIYSNHREQVKLQMSREPKKLPSLWLNPEVKDLFLFKYDDIKLVDYNPHPAIKGEVAV